MLAPRVPLYWSKSVTVSHAEVFIVLNLLDGVTIELNLKGWEGFLTRMD